MNGYAGLQAMIDWGICLKAAHADIFGTLRDRGHEEATVAMGSILNSMIGSRARYAEDVNIWTLFVAWDSLTIFSGERPTVKVRVTFKIDHAVYTKTVEIDARMLEPHNIPAMEVMLG